VKIDSNHLKKLRAAHHWSQEQLSEVSGLSLRTIQRLESGGTASIESVRALAAAFNVDPDTLILSEHDVPMTPLDAVETGLLQFWNFSGTATRFEYWWFLAFVVVFTAICTVINEKAYQVAMIILLIPLLAAGARRLNDAGQSQWWQLFFFVPFGQIVALIVLAQPTKNDPNHTNTFDAA
jgi:transcriptional regulator with XRE-family HTH domain